ncbi:MAG: bifunctional folylpolyglutamate synthase/dihydrofolate synthase [Epsilonproteobacteria bacterium]|nr:bifunctional folylpolyglutamate synthase/dihydrofolate synthase [Campylobacterota bacterium]
MNFLDFLDSKPLYYKEIDHQRVHNAYAILKPHLKAIPTIHIVGTNGKGSTGRMIASLLFFQGFKVMHYSSPHIKKFNERIWIDGEDSCDEILQKAHEKLFTILGVEMSDELSYFEYSTLLALVVGEESDFMILEAGLGGEFDATNVAPKILSVITPIGIDHQAFLGDTIEQIATTKLNSITSKALMGFQDYQEVYDIANKKNAIIHILDKKEENSRLKKIIDELFWGDYLYDNARLALKALEILNLPYHIEDFYKIELFGRFYPLAKNIRIDVGHNLLASSVMIDSIQKVFATKPILIYNSLDDKDFHAILKNFKPYIKRVEILEIDAFRAIKKETLMKTLETLDISFKDFTTLCDDENYLVFGSFYVVESFLKYYDYQS